jgi:hypothetical protein
MNTRRLLRLSPSLLLSLLLAILLATGLANAKGSAEDGKKEVKERKIIIEKDVKGGPQKAFLGVVPRPLDHVLRAALDYEEAGVLLAEVTPDGPAAKAGVRVGEILVKFNNRPVHDVDRLFALMKEVKTGETVELVLQHKDKQRTLQVVLAARPSPELSWLDAGGGLQELGDARATMIQNLGCMEDMQLELEGMKPDGNPRQIRIITREETEGDVN